MSDTKIQWTDAVWNPVRGCSIVSPGCQKCYAMKTANRFSGPGGTYEGLTRDGANGPIWTGAIRLVPEKLAEPLHWRKPRRVFVNSMSDLFHESVPDAFIRKVFGVMSSCGQHTFQVLTKRPERMRDWFADEENDLSACQAEWVASDECETRTPKGRLSLLRDDRAINGTMGPSVGEGNYWPLPNVWLGVSVEDQQRADERIPLLLRTPAAVRFLSCEPLLGPVDLSDWLPEYRGAEFDPGRPLDWVIAGGESGHGARACDLTWVRSLVEQCQGAGTAAFVKQLGCHVVASNDAVADWFDSCPHLQQEATERLQGATGRITGFRDRRHGGDIDEFPEDLRVREFPRT